jgi:hypothetical protein
MAKISIYNHSVLSGEIGERPQITGKRAMHRERVEVLPTKFSLACGAVEGYIT